MKKIVFYSVVAILLVSFFMMFNSLLKQDNTYIIKNDKGNIVEAFIYPRWKDVNGEKIQELVLYFEKIETAEKVLIFVPIEKLIGLPEGGSSSFFRILGKYLYQKESGKKFMPINNSIQELITDYSFSNTSITFNTFGGLKQYGSRIIIEKR